MKILVTNYFLKNFTGSEINTLQICTALKELGFDADAATFFFDEPLKSKFLDRNIKVKNLLHDDFELEEYDIFWTHHTHTINHIIFHKKPESTKIIYSCLGPFSSLAVPPYYHNELNCILSNSKGNTQVLRKEGISIEKIKYFPNFSPEYYFSQPRTHFSKILTRIAVISNHPPQELDQFSLLAKDSGHVVEFIGLDNNHVYVDPNIIKKFDLIISIGKTVQYCFSLKVPIYCYDHFGGPGFITPDNIHFEEFYNFSGRATNRVLSGYELFDDIFSNFAGAVNHLDFLFDYSKENFLLEKNIQELFGDISLSKNLNISEIRENYALTERHHNDFLRMLQIQLAQENQLTLKRNTGNLVSSIDSSQFELEQEVLSYSLSRSWRMTRPFRKILKLIKKVKRA